MARAFSFFGKIFSFFFIFFSMLLSLGMAPAPIDEATTLKKFREIMQAHASEKKLNAEIMQRIFLNYIDLFDPAKIYLTKEEIGKWLEMDPQNLQEAQERFEKGDFSDFREILVTMQKAIPRKRELSASLDIESVKERGADPAVYRKLGFVDTQEDLVERVVVYRGLQARFLDKVSPEMREKILQRVEKREKKFEEEFLNTDPTYQKELVDTYVLKAAASALDVHTSYFTPEEAEQFLIAIQQRLDGIGVALRDDIAGFSIIKIVEGGPAFHAKSLRPKDIIIAVDGEPVVGMDIEDVVKLIRGPTGTKVQLTILRESAPSPSEPEKVDVTLERGEVVFTEARYKARFIPFGEGSIAVLKLFSFYQDPDGKGSSANDLRKELERFVKENDPLGVVLDLRSNTGGLLTQAVEVAGLFIKRGIVVSIKDDKGRVQHLRNLNPKPLWEGPLVILTNRASASASEIVAGTLQDYGRALIVGDDRTFGKGSYQTFTLEGLSESNINVEGEYKVTRGRYYTVSGNTPQVMGVKADIVVPGPLSQKDIGESFAKYPLSHEEIEPNFKDTLDDIPPLQKAYFERFYYYQMQEKESKLLPYLEKLRKNSALRVEQNRGYRDFLESLQGDSDADVEEEEVEEDLQEQEALNIMRDLIFFIQFGAEPEEKEAA